GLFQSSCETKIQKDVFCSWIGTLENENQKKIIGAACYPQGAMPAEEETKLADIDLCREWMFGSTGVHRLVIPSQVSTWNTDFLIYYPPATDQHFMNSVFREAGKKHVNPERRTGLVGQGPWKNLGENRMDIPILIRSYRGVKQIMVIRKNSSYEVTTTVRGTIYLNGPAAMFYRKPRSGNDLSGQTETTAEEYFHSLLESSPGWKCSREKLANEMKTKRKIFNSYLSHPYETDNAWVKAKVYIIIAPENSCLYNMNLKAPENHLDYQWKSYNDSTLRSLESVVNTAFDEKQSKNQSSSEQNEDLKKVTDSIAEILPQDEKTQCQMKKAQWAEEKKIDAARNVFHKLKKLIKNPLEFSFDKLIVGSKCNITGGHGAILHMKIKPNVTCKESLFMKSCDENNRMVVYCSWIGILEKEKHKKMIGAVCYMSKTMSQEFHRLEIPRQVSSKATDFLLYYPPATDLEYHSIVDEMGPEFSKVYVNQEGRTGLIGRGIWISLGENRMDIPILLRRYNGTRQILVATGQDKGQLKGPLAMFYRKPKTSELLKIWNETDANDYFYSMVPGNRGNCTREKFDKDMKGKRKLFNSYLSHPYETDNAWVKARVYILTVSETSCLYNLNLKSPSNYLHYEWRSFKDSTLQTAENLVNSMFNKVESKTIIAGNRLSAAKYLAIFITAAIIISIAFFSITSAFIIGLPVALVGLAAAIGAAYQRRWIHIHDYIHMC
ncbi:hypothetical protein TTRE_0000804101, partial [Trichuris trichiura]